MATGEVVGSILLAGDQLLGVEQLAVGAGADLVNDGGLEIQEDTAGHMLASTGLGEEGVEGIITATDGLVRGHLQDGQGWSDLVAEAAPCSRQLGTHLAIRLDPVLQAVELPAGVSDLDTGLTDMDGDDLTHSGLLEERKAEG